MEHNQETPPGEPSLAILEIRVRCTGCSIDSKQAHVLEEIKRRCRFGVRYVV